METKTNQEIDCFDVVVVGDSGVGKSELLKSFGYSKDTDNHVYMTRTIDIYGYQAQLHIWNVSSNDIHVTRTYTRGASGVVIVYDVTCRDSFESIQRCISILGPETVVLMLGNKCDMTDQREITKEEGGKLATNKGITFLETSAINDFNVNNAFTILVRHMLWRRRYKRIVLGLVENSSNLGQKLMANTPEDSFETLMFCNILKFGVEEMFHIRVMLVGNEGVGKSTLLRRLLRKPVNINKYESTNGIDVHIRSCDVDLESGTWCVNESREAGVSAVAKLRRYLVSLANSKARNEAREVTRSFHMRVAKMFTNMGTHPKINKAPFPLSCQTGHYSKREPEGDRHIQTTMQEYGDHVPKTDVSETCDDGTFVTPAHPSIGNDDIGAILAKIKSLEALKEGPKAKVDFYDFAGQLVFHASHPTFLSSRAIYIVTFNLCKINSDYNALNDNKAPASKNGKVNQSSVCDMDSIFFWLNTVFMFTGSKGYIQPHVILVGTHVDKSPRAIRDQVADTCFRKIRSSLADSPLRYIISDKEFAVDNTKKTDPCFADLQTEILKLARLQPWWGEKTPSRWLPLDREIQLQKDNGLKVISFSNVSELNSGLDVKIPNEEELERFLQFLNDTGEIIYFNEPTLRNYVVLDPIWLINALKALITADRFAIRSPHQANKWKRFCETGIINRSTLIAILKENTDDPTLFENSEHVLRLMEKFLFIASPIDISEDVDENRDTNIKDIEYIVPSMVQNQINTEPITSSDGLSSTTVLSLVSKNNFLPSAVFHKLLAKCISKWQIVEQNGKKQINSEVCKFNLDHQKNCKLIIVSVQNAVHAKIISYIDTSRPRSALCKRVHEFLNSNLKHILTSMGFSDEFRTCIQCPRFSSVTSGGYLDTELMDNQEFVTCDECKVSHVLQTTDLINCWKDKGATCLEKESAPQTHNSTKHSKIGKVANQARSDNIETPDFENSSFDAPITQGHLSHARVCNALVTVCAEGLRDILLSQIPPPYPDFYQLLRARKAVITAMRNVRQEQIDILFPDPRGRYTGTVDQFDTTLLYTLIRNISSVPAPVTGWGKPPSDNPRDMSLGASTERIRICRNCVSGHSMDGRLDGQSFEHYWKDICSIMGDIEQALGEKGYKDALKKRKQQILSPEEAQSLKLVFDAFLTEVLSAVKIVTEKMRTLQTMAEDHN